MPKIWAEEALRERGGEYTAKGIYELTKIATGSEDEAQRAMTKKIDTDLRAGKTPEF